MPNFLPSGLASCWWWLMSKSNWGICAEVKSGWCLASWSWWGRWYWGCSGRFLPPSGIALWQFPQGCWLYPSFNINNIWVISWDRWIYVNTSFATDSTLLVASSSSSSNEIPLNMEPSKSISERFLRRKFWMELSLGGHEGGLTQPRNYFPIVKDRVQMERSQVLGRTMRKASLYRRSWEGKGFLS